MKISILILAAFTAVTNLAKGPTLAQNLAVNIEVVSG